MLSENGVRECCRKQFFEKLSDLFEKFDLERLDLGILNKNEQNILGDCEQKGRI